MGFGNSRGEKTGGGSRPMRGVVIRGWAKGGVGDRGEHVEADAAFKSGDLGDCCGAAPAESEGASRDAAATGFEGASWPASVTDSVPACGGGTFIADDIGARTSVLGAIGWQASDGGSTAAGGGGGGGATRVGFGGDEFDEDEDGRDEAAEECRDDS